MFVDKISEAAQQALEEKDVEPKPHKWPACPVVYEIPGPEAVRWLYNEVALTNKIARSLVS